MQLARPVLAALGLIAFGACFRDRAAPRTLENRDAPALVMAGAGDELAFLPADSDLVLGLDVRQLLQSALWKHFEPQLLQALGTGLQDFRTACGFSPLETLRGATVGAKVNDGPFDGVIVLRGMDRDKTLACARRGGTPGAKVRLDGEVITASRVGGGEPPIAMRFADAHTLVMASSRAKLDAALAAGAPLRRSRAFSELWTLVDTRRTLWLVANGSARMFDSLSSFGLRPRAMFGSVALRDGLALTGRLRLGTADEATQLTATVQAQLGMVQSLVDKVSVSADGADVAVELSMTMAQIDSIASMMSGVLGSGPANPLGGP